MDTKSRNINVSGKKLIQTFYKLELHTRVIVVVAAIIILGVSTFPQNMIFIVISIVCLIRHVVKLATLEKGAKKIEAGNYVETIDIKYGEFGTIANALNTMSKDLTQVIEEQIKSERMKTELITHVSHDIRTPLTSLITYTDLLRKENLDNEKAIEYIEVLVKKANRLNVLVDDLFEASKAASGNIEVNLEVINLTECMNQALGEMEGVIVSSGVEFVTNLIDNGHVLADGRLIWRIIENLIGNACKYSLSGSRVYVSLTRAGGYIKLEMKNTANYPLNIDPDKLMEKFVRGDLARTTEGSGLGLSIVQSFIEAQNGKFDIKIDGDLFKVSVYFKILSE